MKKRNCMKCMIVFLVLLCVACVGMACAECLMPVSSDVVNDAVSIRFYEEDGKYGIEDTKGNILSAPRYGEVLLPWMTDETIDLTYTYVEENGLWGVIRADGFMISAPQWDIDIIKALYIDGYIDVPRGGKWGLMDKDGSLIFEVKYQNPVYYYEEYGAAIICRNDSETGMAKYGVAREDGKILIPMKYDVLYSISENRIFYYDDEVDKWGVLDMQGNVISAPLYTGDSSLAFSSGYADVYKGDMGGYIDLYGNVAIPFQYSDIRPFEGEYALVKDAAIEKYGIIDKTGQYVVDPIFYCAYGKSIYSFYEKKEDMEEKNPIHLSLQEAVDIYSKK